MKWVLKIAACFAILILSYGIANDSPSQKWLIGTIGGIVLTFVLHLIDQMYNERETRRSLKRIKFARVHRLPVEMSGLVSRKQKWRGTFHSTPS